MKTKRHKIQLKILLILISLLNVTFQKSFTSNKAVNEKLKKISCQEISIRNCHSINFSGQGEIVIEQGKKSILKIEADEDIFPTIQTDFSDKTLNINFSKTHQIKEFKKLKFHITVNTLSHIYLNGNITLECSNLETNDLDICAYGSVLIDITELKTPKLNVYSFGDNYIEITGETDKQIIHLNGESNYDAQKLKSLETQIQTFGTANVFLWIEKSLKGDMVGLGNIQYDSNTPDDKLKIDIKMNKYCSKIKRLER